MTYQFAQQDRIGQLGAKLLDRYCSALWHLEPASMADEQRGIDRLAHANGKTLYLEYKTDIVGHRTGNAFIETEGNQEESRPGWAIASEAHILLYFFPVANHLLLFRLARLRQCLAAYRQRYRQVRIPNRAANGKRYTTLGLLVPIRILVRDRVAILIDFSASPHPVCQFISAQAYAFN